MNARWTHHSRNSWTKEHMDFSDNILTSSRSRHFVKKSTTLSLLNNNIFHSLRLQASVFTHCRFYFKILNVHHTSTVLTSDQCDPSLTHCEHDCFTGINLLLVGWAQQTPSWKPLRKQQEKCTLEMTCCNNNWCRRWKVHIKLTKEFFFHKSRKVLLFSPNAEIYLVISLLFVRRKRDWDIMKNIKYSKKGLKKRGWYQWKSRKTLCFLFCNTKCFCSQKLSFWFPVSNPF